MPRDEASGLRGGIVHGGMRRANRTGQYIQCATELRVIDSCVGSVRRALSASTHPNRGAASRRTAAESRDPDAGRDR